MQVFHIFSKRHLLFALKITVSQNPFYIKKYIIKEFYCQACKLLSHNTTKIKSPCKSRTFSQLLRTKKESSRSIRLYKSTVSYLNADYNLDTSIKAVRKAVHTLTLIFLTHFKCFGGQVVDLLIVVWYNRNMLEI